MSISATKPETKTLTLARSSDGGVGRGAARPQLSNNSASKVREPERFEEVKK